MKNTHTTLWIAGTAALLVVLSVMKFLNQGTNPDTDSRRLLPTNDQLISISTPSSFEIPSLKIENPPSTSEDAWAVLQKYLMFAKDHDIEGLKSVSHQLSATCNDVSKKEECYVLMDSVYSFGSELKKEDFVNMWQDAKQIILFTKIKAETTENVRGYSKGVLYFTKDNFNNVKLLGINPSHGAFVRIDGKTEEETDAILDRMMKDGDEDGLDDEFDVCQPGELSCAKTDPQKRDTDNDGWWDGIEVLFK